MSKIENTVKIFKEIHPEYLLLFQFGTFYRAYGKDSYILSYIFGYCMTEIQGLPSAGFPKAALNKVMTKLEEHSISYMVLNKSDQYKEENKENFKSKNKYKETYEIAKKYISIKNRIDKIHRTMVDEISSAEIREKIIRIEKILYG